MTVNELLKVMQEIKKVHGGSIKVVLSKDEEGNEFSGLDIRYSLHLVRKNEDSIFNEEGLSNLARLDKLNKQEVIGVCLFPYFEGYETPEEATKVG